jgi:hypothetical protein
MKWIVVPLAVFLLTSGALLAQDEDVEEPLSVENAPEHLVPVYRITITNITRGQLFGPILVATHRPGVRIFELGRPASAELETLAETGDPRPLAEWLRNLAEVKAVTSTNAVLKPGESVTIRVRTGWHGFHRVSLASKLLPTNDGFFALNSVRGPLRLHGKSFFSPALDAGTEVNDELCASIPGPDCGGNGGEDEGFVVHVHSGIHGIGHLIPARRDWRNPVARVRVRLELVDPVSETLEP